jgi:alkyl sulfatase BDS1-like metallo-beta-lactamase superfamily hydrolase
MDARRAAENVYMPVHLRKGRESYGQLESHVKQVYSGRIGWMGNDVYDINPLAVKEEARRTVELMGGFDQVRLAAGDAAKKGGFENWSWALRLTSLLLELNPDDKQTQMIRAEAARAIGQRTTSANARGWYITEALAMENKLQLGGQPVTLVLMRELAGTPEVDQVMALPLEDSFQYIRYLVDPRKAEDMRLEFTVMVDGADQPYGIELRNGIIVIKESAEKAKVHLNLTRQEWSEFVAGERSLADQENVLARFEGVLARTTEPEGTETLDEAISDTVDALHTPRRGANIVE